MDKAKDVVRDFLGGRPSYRDDGGVPVNTTDDAPFNYDAAVELSRVAPGMYRPIPEKVILEWVAPSRPFRKRNKQFFTTVLVIASLISLILFFSGQFLPIAMVFSVVFLNYVLAVIPPQDISHSITNLGIKVEGKLYSWQELGRFWFDKKYDSLLLYIETAYFPGRLILVLPEEKRQVVTELLTEVLLQQRPPLTTIEKLAKWFQEKFPLE